MRRPNHPALILIKGKFLKSEVQHDVTTFLTLAALQKKPRHRLSREHRGDNRDCDSNRQEYSTIRLFDR
jgi:hypothetical protein